jgi:hypothetical protein
MNPSTLIADWERVPQRCPYCDARRVEARVWYADATATTAREVRCTNCLREWWTDDLVT